jgi:MOSC domain-containing protein YiiM
MLPDAPRDDARLLSVNVGLPEAQPWAGFLRRTAIRKTPVPGPVGVRWLGLDGDEVADTKHHGGTHMAVYAFAQEDYDHWSAELGEIVPPATFGENLTTVGIDVNEALVGEQWRVGTALLQVVGVRIPCNVFKNWMGVAGFDTRAWVRRFTEHARPGPYLRVLEQGVLQAGDPIVVEHRPVHDVSVSTMFRACTTDRTQLPRLADLDVVAPAVRARAAEYVATYGALTTPDAGRRRSGIRPLATEK